MRKCDLETGYLSQCLFYCVCATRFSFVACFFALNEGKWCDQHVPLGEGLRRRFVKSKCDGVLLKFCSWKNNLA